MSCEPGLLANGLVTALLLRPDPAALARGALLCGVSDLTPGRLVQLEDGGVVGFHAGFCQAGAPPACDDGAFCNGAETCNETTDSCDAGTPPACDDGLYCNGAESCNETTDSCDFAANDANCDNGQYCDGAETCHTTLDCQAGTAAPDFRSVRLRGT